MDALGIVLAVLIGLVVLAGIAFFGFVAWFIFKTFRRVFSDQKEFDTRWSEGPFNRRHNR
jgi:hypothetical protein